LGGDYGNVDVSDRRTPPGQRQLNIYGYLFGHFPLYRLGLRLVKLQPFDIMFNIYLFEGVYRMEHLIVRRKGMFDFLIGLGL
jgi:hypothetical protein